VLNETFSIPDRLCVRRQERECAAVERDDGAEVSRVEAEDAGRPVALSEDDQRAVDESELQVGVARFKVQHGRVVLALEAG